jgi:hypothetical protein
MTLFITDANIFIDLYYAGLLKLMPSLGISFATTQLVSDELNQEQQFDLQLLIISKLPMIPHSNYLRFIIIRAFQFKV